MTDEDMEFLVELGNEFVKVILLATAVAMSDKSKFDCNAPSHVITPVTLRLR